MAELPRVILVEVRPEGGGLLRAGASLALARADVGERALTWDLSERQAAGLMRPEWTREPGLC